MRRWTVRVLVGLCSLIVAVLLAGATYQWLATRRDLALALEFPGFSGHRLASVDRRSDVRIQRLE